MNLHILSTFVLATHWLIVAGLTLRVIMMRSPVGVSLAWLSVIASTPFVGAAVYSLVNGDSAGKGRRALRRTSAP